ncbi:hypothetical protein IFM89_037781 [Coptis chinensis]|uniref:AP180 N-terminal homology (ANTH) domain-containing protein n=1 Tax=Coptis chinensis TaxID=261450 RepID=A0A835LHQ2_9MAGN|nr:hypothetical protein IFM89_037781 [Coptis chinensis]
MTSSASGMATGHGLEELNWQQLEQKSHTPAVLDLISLDDVPSQSHLWKLLLNWCDGYRRTGNLVRTSTNESGGVYKSETGLFVATRSGLEKDLVQVSGETFDVLGSVDVGQVSLSDCVLPTTAGQGLKTNQVTNNPGQSKFNLMDLGDAYKLAVGNKGWQASSIHTEQHIMKDSVTSQISVTQGSELSVNDMSPRVTTKKMTLPDKLEKDYLTVPIYGFFIGGPLYDDVDYNIEASKRTRDLDTAELLEQIPALQQLLFRVLGCQPQGAAVIIFVIQLALSMVAAESKKIYSAISDGTVKMLIRRRDCLSFTKYAKASILVMERVQAPASFLTAMEEYVRDAPRASSVHSNKVSVDKIAAPKKILAIEYNKTSEEETIRPLSPPPAETVEVEIQTWVSEPPDLLGLNDATPYASDLDEKNAFALAIVPVATPSADAPSTGYNSASGAGWELALVTSPSSNESAASANKLEYSFSPSAHVIELGSAMGTISLLSATKRKVFLWKPDRNQKVIMRKHEPIPPGVIGEEIYTDNLFSQGSVAKKNGEAQKLNARLQNLLPLG